MIGAHDTQVVGGRPEGHDTKPFSGLRKASAPRQSKNPQGLTPRGVYSLRPARPTRSRRSMFGSTCELCLVSAVAMEAAIDGRIQTCARCPHPGSAWNGEAAGSREAVQPVLHTWLVVCGNEPVFLATASMQRTAWDISHGTKGSRPRKNH